MQYGICPLSVAPLRAKPADSSEMVSQLLFGELVEIIEKEGNWIKVICLWDEYEGWMDIKQIEPILTEVYENYKSNSFYSLELIQPAAGSNHYLPITIGAALPDFDGINFRLNKNKYTFSGQAINPFSLEASPDLICKIGRKFLYAPYLWGGRSPFGIDCSGLTQVVYKLAGIKLPRDASQQVEGGKTINIIDEAQPGDLAFFENKKGNITHVGILFPDRKILHASGRVRIDDIDHVGIHNKEVGKYTHNLRIIKRFIADHESIQFAAVDLEKGEEDVSQETLF